jgi:hypothetical protein
MSQSYHPLPGLNQSKVWGIAACIATLSFVVSLAILWERQPRPNSAPPAALFARDTMPAQDTTRSPTLSAPPIGHRDSKQPVTAAPVASASVAPAPSEPMPVSLQVVHNRRLRRIEAFVGNLSASSLSIEVGIVHSNTRNTSTFMLDLVPQATRTFGTDEGMTLTEGDQVTLKSAEYQPLSRQVP